MTLDRTLDRIFIPALVAAAALIVCAVALVRPEPSPSAGAQPALTVADKNARNAAFEHARQRCASYIGDAQASCVIIARAHFDRI